jgi:hypothetical protein
MSGDVHPFSRPPVPREIIDDDMPPTPPIEAYEDDPGYYGASSHDEACERVEVASTPRSAPVSTGKRGRPPAGRWFRFLASERHDPNLLRLNDKQFRVWILLFVAEGRDGKGGTVFPSTGEVPSYDDFGREHRIPPYKAKGFYDEFLELGMLIKHADGRIFVRNWSSRQYVSDNSTDRAGKSKANFDQ